MEFGPLTGLDELCPVCGDKVSGYHYGLLTCESCKGFFKRTVQNNKRYVCAEFQDCRIDKSQRKRCPFCRFQKCLHVGMRLEAVRADRMRGGRNKFGPMYKRDRALKQQRRALNEAGGFRTDNAPPLTLTRDLQPDPALLCTSLPVPDCFSLLPPSLCPLLPPLSPAAAQDHTPSSSYWTIKNCTGSEQLPSLPLSMAVPQMPALMLELLKGGLDELQLQEKICARLLQEQTPLSTFSLQCIIADQTLLCTVEWARTCIFFKQLRVGDQMKLLQKCWSDLLLLDVVSRQLQYGREGQLLLVTGQEIELSDVSSHASPTLSALIQRGQMLLQKLHSLKADHQELTCIKFLILFNPEVQLLEDHSFVESVQQQVEGALLEYTLQRTYSQLLGRFSQLLLCVSELRCLSSLAEDYLDCKHLSGDLPGNSLLLEMLHTRRNRT